MTTGKRALIVDDSRSARVILSRMLEQHGLAVDTAESAEQALDYLQQHRPDVIFMDHLMPGMDGFQAVQAIKGDPQTATIPLMMYTSQEGELYVSQARALGAVGVLPKTVRPAEVSRLLYQLRLLPDRRQDRLALFQRPAPVAPPDLPVASTDASTSSAEPTAPRDAAALVAASTLSEFSAGLRQSVQQLVKDQLAEHRRFLLATFEAFARRITTEIKESAQKTATPAPVEMPPVEPPARQWWPVALTALLAVVPACVLGFLYLQELRVNQDFGGKLSRLDQEVAALAKATAVAAARATARAEMPASGPGSVQPVLSFADSTTASETAGSRVAQAQPVEYVQYGDVPFGGPRLAHLQELAASLESQNFRGRIVLEYSVGDFCLTGNQQQGFEPANPSLPVRDCDLVGNPFDDSLSAAQRQSLNFANFIATLDRRTGGAITVVTVNAGRRSPVGYPEQSESITAGAWNVVAAQNNRVEIRTVPSE